MSDNIDASLRLAALNTALAAQRGPALALELVASAYEFYAFLRGGYPVKRPASEPAIETKDPLPLAGEHPIETGAALAADEAIKRKRRTKAEMEAARAADPTKPPESAMSATGGESSAAPDSGPSAISSIADATTRAPAPAVSIAPDQVVMSVADIKKALHAVVEKNGLGPVAGGKLLAQFGVKRLSELDEKIFADFIAACNAAVAA